LLESTASLTKPVYSVRRPAPVLTTTSSTTTATTTYVNVSLELSSSANINGFYLLENHKISGNSV